MLHRLSVRSLCSVGALALAAAGCARSAEPAARLGRDYAYWRGGREVTPGPFLCTAPAAEGVTVVSDRWPDGSDLRQFGLDAARLSGAETDHQKAIAVWRWVRRWTMYTDGNPPTERLRNPSQARHRSGYIDDPVKILDVYGAHWCDGLSRVVEAVWRAMGYRAEKLYRSGHTMVICGYRDADDAFRWHWFDVSEGRYLLDNAGKRVLSPDELSTDTFYWMTGWVYCNPLSWHTHRAELSFRPGEKLERFWGSRGVPYQDNVRRDHQTVPEWERGPYKVDYGNGTWEYSPDLSDPAWVKGLAEPPRGMAEGKLQPAEAGEPGTAVWRFRTPYIVSDAEVELDLARAGAGDVVRLHLSVDDGRSWKRLWECPADAVGEKKLKFNICDKYKVTKKADPPAGFNSPFGRYHYRLKLELAAREKPEDCRVKAIAFRTGVQQNFYSLPQLQPGRNAITVKGRLAPGAALKVTYVWDDPAGKDRRNVTVVEKTPHTYEIVAAGKEWNDCVCKSITVEAVAADGKGSRALEKETPAEFAALPPMRPAGETRARGFMKVCPPREGLPPLEKLVAAIAEPKKVPLRELNAAIRALNVYRDGKAFDAVKKVAFEVGRKNGPKEAAMTTLFTADREKARAVLLHMVESPGNSALRDDDPENPAVAAGHFCTVAAVAGYMAAEAGWKEFVPHLVRALESPHCHVEARRGLLRVLGRLGDPRAVQAVRKDLGGKDLDTVPLAARAAGQLGDRGAIPRLRELLGNSYGPARYESALALALLGDRESAPVFRRWLTERSNESYRGIGARVLGQLKDRDSIPALEKALAAEPARWVREEIEAALAALGAGSGG
jgi:hypothetical protein